MCRFHRPTIEEIASEAALKVIRDAGGFVECDEHIPRAPDWVWLEGEDPHDRCPRCQWPLENGHMCPTEC